MVGRARRARSDFGEARVHRERVRARRPTELRALAAPELSEKEQLALIKPA